MGRQERDRRGYQVERINKWRREEGEGEKEERRIPEASHSATQPAME